MVSKDHEILEEGESGLAVEPDQSLAQPLAAHWDAVAKTERVVCPGGVRGDCRSVVVRERLEAVLRCL